MNTPSNAREAVEKPLLLSWYNAQADVVWAAWCAADDSSDDFNPETHVAVPNDSFEALSKALEALEGFPLPKGHPYVGVGALNDDIRAALASRSAPDGWVLVRREVLEPFARSVAGYDQLPDEFTFALGGDTPISLGELRAVAEALAAAPSAPSGEGEAAKERDEAEAAFYDLEGALRTPSGSDLGEGVAARIVHYWPLPWSSTRPGDERMVDVLDAHGRSILHMEWPFHSAEEADEAEQITYALADMLAKALSPSSPTLSVDDTWKSGTYADKSGTFAEEEGK